MTSSANGNRAVKVLFIALTAMYSFGALASLFRLRFGDDAIINLGYQRIALPIIVLICAYIAFEKTAQVIDRFSFFIVSLMIYGLVWGITQNGANYYTVIHLFAAFVAVVPYLCGRSMMLNDARQVRSDMRMMCYVVTAVHVPIMLVYTYWTMSGAVYFGMSASILILCTIFFLDEARWKWALLAAVMVVVSGKRGEIIGIFFAISTWLMVRGLDGGFVRVARYALIAMCGAFLFGIISVAGHEGAILGSVGQKFDTFLMADFTDLTSADTRAAIGGRGAELMMFSETFFANGLDRLALGLGYGWSIPMLSIEGAEVDTLAVVHVSPLNAIGQYGLMLGAVFWVWLAIICIKGLFGVGRVPGNRVLVPYVVGILFASLSAYVISVDPGFWLCLGAASLFNLPRDDLTNQRRIPLTEGAPRIAA